MFKVVLSFAIGLCCVYAGAAWAVVDDPDLWPAPPGDPIDNYLDRSIFEQDMLPPGIEAVLDFQGDLAVVAAGGHPDLADFSSHLLDFGTQKAYHFRPFHKLASARFSPDRTRIAAVLAEPSDHAIMIYTLDSREGRMLAGVRAVGGSIDWLDDGRISYQPWIEGQPSEETTVVELSTADYVSRSSCSVEDNRVVPMVTCCGGTCDDFNCGGNNPYPCCSNGGNCTWWAWDRACRNWVVALPGWGNAHSWYANAQAAGYPTGLTPEVGSIAVDTNDTFGSYGHVVWVLSYTSTTLTVSEQNCCTGCNYGDRIYTWPRSYFDGYIYNPNPGPPSIVLHPSNQSVCSAGVAIFTVSASGSGTLTYQWQKNSANITNGGHYSDCTTASLTVSNCTSGEVANYRCVVTNTNGSTPSNQASLSLKAATTITQNPSNVIVSPGQTAQFSVTATGDGSLAYQWQKNSVNITNGGHYSGCTTAALAISSATDADEGSYRCVVTAGCGSATSTSASLIVGQPADFNGDGDVDVEDFAVLQNCLGATNPLQDPTCGPTDLNVDNLVNTTDVSRFIGCMSGAEIQGNPDCLP